MHIDVEEYYKKYGPMVFRRCRTILRDEDRALDAMQEVFVKLLINREKLEDAFPSSLLFRMATNICLNIIRSDGRRPDGCGNNLHSIAMYDETEERVLANDLLDRIFRAEQKSTREIAVMHYVDKMTHAEIAKEVGLSVSGVRKRLRTMKERVKEMREEENEGRTNI